MEVALYNKNKSDQEISALSASDIHQANSREYCEQRICSYNLCSGEYWIIYIVSNI